MVAAHDSVFLVGEEGGGGKYVLPYPGFVGVGEFFGEGVGHMNGAAPMSEVFFMYGAGFGKVFAQGGDDAIGEGCLAVVTAFSVVDKDAVVFKVYIFDAQAKAFHKT